ncbi:hypothetical protein NYA22BAC_01679 [Parasphingorhabdus sp. NYA22]
MGICANFVMLNLFQHPARQERYSPMEILNQVQDDEKRGGY